MNQASLEEQLRTIVLSHSRNKAREVSADSVLTRDLGFDSLAFLLAMTDIDETFGVEMQIEQVEDLPNLTYRQLVALVHGKINGSGSA